ncbi:hypothetical protein [Kozakia baliensis]|nr:hypothetical protein [Kozakia baliensis]GBR26293.1 hypothetical protein AA0488_0865 [Kozakia baliensis NRIC 0488]GEL64395.1 hypothetical protein KBA01_16810 [Kozakia baliensis]
MSQAQKVKQDVPVIGWKELIIMHVVLALFIAVVAYVDWSIPN